MPEFNAGAAKAYMIADSQGFHAGIQGVKKDMQSLKQEAKEVKESWRDLGLAAGVSFALITAGVAKATQANIEFKNSFAGLSSVAKSFNQDAAAATKAAQSLSKDGLMSVSDAATGLKNLLASGFSLDQAIALMTRFKDIASFNKSAALGFGEAIKGATEGIRNGNSVLVDNIGLTKNLSMIMKEAGFSEQDVMNVTSNLNVRMAMFKGLMKETNPYIGDAAKLAGMLGGQLAQAETETKLASAALGDDLEPALTVVVGGYSHLVAGIKEFIQANPGFVAGATAGATALTLLVSASSAWIALDMAKKLKNAFEIMTSGPGLAIIALSALASVLVGVATAAAKAREENLKLADKYRDESLEVKGLISEYQKLQELQKTGKITVEQKQRLVDLSNQIAKILPGAIVGWDKEANAIIDVNSALKEMILLKGQELRLRLQEINLQEKDNMVKQRATQSQVEDIKSNLEQIDQLKKQAQENGSDSLLPQEKLLVHDESKYQDNLRKTKTALKGLQDEHHKLIAEEKAINDLLDKGISPGDIKPTKTKPGGGGNGTGEAQAQADLASKLHIEQLERQKQFEEAEIAEEKKRYNTELDLAKGNATLTQQVKQGHEERLKAIEEKYLNERKELQQSYDKELFDLTHSSYESQLNDLQIEENKALEQVQNNEALRLEVIKIYQLKRKQLEDQQAEEERQRNEDLQSEIIQMTGTKEEQEEGYIRRHKEQMERDKYNQQQIQDWETAYHKQKLME